MSLNGSLLNAMSGLRANAAQTQVISSNIANAMTASYTSRSLIVAPQSIGGVGGGVAVVGVQRNSNMLATQDRRGAETLSEGDRLSLSGLERLELMFGNVSDGSSLAGRLLTVQSTLIAAQTDPASPALLEAVSLSLDLAVKEFNTLSSSIQSLRAEADLQISREVTTLNEALSAIDKLNGQIVRSLSQSEDPAALQDQRQSWIDKVAQILPVRELPRADGSSVLMAEGGTLLLDTRQLTVEFSAVGNVAVDMSYANGSLSGVFINGQELNLAAISGGRLAAAFELRDKIYPEAQNQLDTLALDFAARLDLGTGSMLSDQGQPTDPAARLGLAQRLTLLPQIKEEPWRLRDGWDATAPGVVGDGSRLSQLSFALESQTPGQGIVDRANAVQAHVSQNRLQADAKLGFSQAYYDVMFVRESARSVDTDAEMQSLLLVEKAYAANARLISVVDEMLRQILEAV